MNPHNHSQMIPGKEAKTIQWGKKTTFSTKIVGKLDIHMHKNSCTLTLHYTQKELKMDQRSKCKTSIHKSLRRKQRRKPS